MSRSGNRWTTLQGRGVYDQVTVLQAVSDDQITSTAGTGVWRKTHPWQLKLTPRPGYRNQDWPQEQSWLKTESLDSAYKASNISTTQADFSPKLWVGAADKKGEQDCKLLSEMKKKKVICLRGQHPEPLWSTNIHKILFKMSSAQY